MCEREGIQGDGDQYEFPDGVGISPEEDVAVLSVQKVLSSFGRATRRWPMYRAWDLGEEKDKEVQKFPLNRGDNKPRRCEQHF